MTGVSGKEAIPYPYNYCYSVNKKSKLMILQAEKYIENKLLNVAKILLANFESSIRAGQPHPSA